MPTFVLVVGWVVGTLLLPLLALFAFVGHYPGDGHWTFWFHNKARWSTKPPFLVCTVLVGVLGGSALAFGCGCYQVLGWMPYSWGWSDDGTYFSLRLMLSIIFGVVVGGSLGSLALAAPGTEQRLRLEAEESMLLREILMAGNESELGILRAKIEARLQDVGPGFGDQPSLVGYRHHRATVILEWLKGIEARMANGRRGGGRCP